MENLKIDKEFEILIPPLTLDEYEQLKSNILSEGEIFNPIFTWNDTSSLSYSVRTSGA